MLTFADIVNSTQGRLLQQGETHAIQYLLLDSRKIVTPNTSIFFAIEGERHDGHKYLADLYNRGVRQFVIESTSILNLDELPLASVVLVKSSVTALQTIATRHREQFSIPVVGITGSNGKTIVKEWLAQLLSIDYCIVRNPRSYNSQIGVPLSVWEMRAQHTLGIFEAGISKVGEMELLERVIQPTVGIFTNIGSAHEEGFESDQQKVGEKLRLFQHCNTLVYCSDHQLIHEEIDKLPSSINRWTWGKSGDASLQVVHQEQLYQQTSIQLKSKGELISFSIPFTDKASIENVLHCVATMLWLGIGAEEVQKRISDLQPVAMRLELKHGINNCYLIDDSYNNDLAGLRIALNFLDQQKQTDKKTLILSDMMETSVSGRELFVQIASLVSSNKIDRFVGIGAGMRTHKDLFNDAEIYTTTEEFLETHSQQSFNNETILIKGARKFEFEQIVKKLQQKLHGTVLEINLDALSGNLGYYRSLLHSDTKIMVMVKAFAYGSGSFEVANLLQFHRIDYLGVAYADEGADLRRHGINLPIMVMNTSNDSFAKMAEYHLEPEIYSFRILEELLSYKKNNLSSTPTKIHLKIDTGMRRLGFEEKDIDKLLQYLHQTPELKVVSVFSHLAAADEAEHNPFTEQQVATFLRIANRIQETLGYTVIRHILNSAGIVRFPEHQFEMVRLGIGLYGVEATGTQQQALQHVGRLKTIISQIKEIAVGDTVGYSRKGKVDKPSRIATIAIGYADGYSRKFSGGVGRVFVRGKNCPVVGNVCMDMTMIDITDTNAEEGDEVIVFGKEISIIDMASRIGTIPYEVLTNVSGRVKRVFYSE